jgi:hypothetical protein
MNMAIRIPSENTKLAKKRFLLFVKPIRYGEKVVKMEAMNAANTEYFIVFSDTFNFFISVRKDGINNANAGIIKRNCKLEAPNTNKDAANPAPSIQEIREYV